ncbi:hypothetical protein [Peterkaempfera griseoplana]|uniref:hypothetical protein n=1 Tax=Peterkaempfera griseoplana TaxID=66896 RepID=UPI0006E32BA8|nr:hypothetical protein [Peterkaempfera griseoplana]
MARLAGMGGIPMVCCACGCGLNHLVVVSEEGAEVVASGGSYFAAAFNAQPWAANTVIDSVGAFKHHLVPDADLSRLSDFLERLPAGALHQLPGAPR